MGTGHFDASAINQVTDYALDLKNFHAGSHARRLVPILVATTADHVCLDLEWSSDGVAKPIRSNESNFCGDRRPKKCDYHQGGGPKELGCIISSSGGPFASPRLSFGVVRASSSSINAAGTRSVPADLISTRLNKPENDNPSIIEPLDLVKSAVNCLHNFRFPIVKAIGMDGALGWS